MITKYNQYIKESLLNKLKGLSYDDIIKNTSVDELLKNSFNSLYDSGVEYALNHGASIDLYNKLIEMKEWFMDILNNIKEFKSMYYSDIIYWEKNNIILFGQNFKTMELWVNYNKIWCVFENKYKYMYDDIQEFIKNMVEKYLNWKGFKPC